MTEIVKLEVQVHKEFLKRIDHWIKRWGYEDHDEFIRSALRLQVRQYEDDEIHLKGSVTYGGSKE